MGRNGSGVRAASETSIEISFTFKGEFCRERVRLRPTPANLKKAALHRAAILHAIDQGTFNYAETFPDSKRKEKFAKTLADVKQLKDYLELWVDEKKRHLKFSTWVDYNRIVKYQLIPSLGHHTLSELGKVHVKDWLKTKDISNKRLANIQSVLRAALDDAVHDEILDVNPLLGWCYERKDEVKGEDDVDPFTSAEQAAILKACDGQFKNLVQFALWTGLRTSELVGLDWSHIDWDRNVITVQQAVTQKAKGEAEVPKTKQSRREVKILKPALDALLDQKQYTFLKQKEVFQDPRWRERWRGDQPIREKFWHDALQLAKVRYRRPYQTRHTYASMMLSAGEPPHWVAAQMGHANTQMITRVYGRWMKEAAPDAGKLAEKVFGKAG